MAEEVVAIGCKRSGNDKCAMSSCTNSGVTPRISLFRFPKDSERCQQWLQYTGRADLMLKTPESLYKSYKLCSKHFERAHFMNDECRRLTYRAIPTVADDLMRQDDIINVPSKSMMRRSLENPSEPVIDGNYFDCLDGVIDSSKWPSDPLENEQLKKQQQTNSYDHWSRVQQSHDQSLSDDHSSYDPSFHDHSLFHNHSYYDQSLCLGSVASSTCCTITVQKQTNHQITNRKRPCSSFQTPPPNKKIKIAVKGRKVLMTPIKIELNKRILVLKSRLRYIKKKNNNVKRCPKQKRSNDKIVHILKQLYKLLPKKSVEFIETQLRLSAARNNGRRWSLNMKLFALSIYYQSQKAYKLLQSLFILPSHRTLQRTMQNSNIHPGFNSDIFNCLKLKFKDVDNLSKYCVLMFDEMSLKTSFIYNKAKGCIDGFEDYGELGRTKFKADHALVFMVRGIARNWKQPLGYFLVSGSVKPPVLQTLVRNCLTKLYDAGMFVTTIVCDQGPTNRCFLENFEKVSVEQPFLLHNNRQVFIIYDPPHLLKNIRNNLKKYGFILNGNIITWKYIEEFYNFDKALSIRMAPRLTSKHLDLPPFTNMRVGLAAQVLSHSVAAGINTLSILNKLDSNAVHTAEFCENFDQLFNACNSSGLHSSQKMGHAIASNTTHEQFLISTLQYISNLKIPYSNKHLPCVNGWKISITAILMLWKELQGHSFKFLMTRRLNQDCLENLFSVIRGLGGNRDNPDVQQFNSSFRHVLIDRLFSPNLGSNCELDHDQMLLDLQNIFKPNFSKAFKSSDQVVPSAENDTDIGLNMAVDCETNVQFDESIDLNLFVESNLTLEVDNVAAYIGGYLLRKSGFCKPDCCKKCLELFTTAAANKLDKHILISSKTFQETGCLIYPSARFCDFIESLEKLFVSHVDSVIYLSSGIIERLYSLGVNRLHLTSCSDTKCINLTKYMIKLYMTVRIYFKIKTLNQEHLLLQNLKRNKKAKKILHE